MSSFTFKRLAILDNTELFSSENENNYFPFHFHDYYCVSLITNGTEVLNNTEHSFMAPAGAISITQANEVHRNYALHETGYSYKTVYINPDVMAFHNNGRKVQALERVIYDRQLFTRFLAVFREGDDNKNLLESAITGLTRHATHPYEGNNTMETYFAKIDGIIDMHADGPVDTGWLASKFRMSKYHFIRSFKKAKGLTPQAYIMLYRLGKTKKLLLADVPLADIAYQAGFHDPSHFTRSFQKYFGVAPSHYRQA
jgi:AraC-like DNA-binding protein